MIFLLSGHGTALQWRSIALQAEAWGMEVRISTAIEEIVAWRNAGNAVDYIVIDYEHFARFSTATVADSLRHLPETFWLVLTPMHRRQGVLAQIPGGTYLPRPVKTAQLRAALGHHIVPSTAASVPEAWHRSSTSETASRRALRILVVEDNPVNQIVARRFLDRLECVSDCVSSGEEALAVLHQGYYDLILMDMQMPVMDGIETTRRIRRLEQEERRRRTTIVALTANVLAEDRDACFAAGMDDYLSKPIPILELRRLLDRYAAALRPPGAA
jgi:CheY-like chemotaxis protein